MTVAVPVAETHIENARQGIAIFGRESGRIKITVPEYLAAEHGQPPAGSAHIGVMIGVGNVDPIDPPEQSFG